LQERYDLECALGQTPTLEIMSQPPAAQASQHWSIGQAAQRTGLSVHALRFYERQGLLLDPVQRGPDGRRAYSESDLEWLDLCIKLRSSGMPLADIRRYTELVRRGPGNEQQRLDVMRQHQQRVVAQMADLNACLELITLKVKLYQGSAAKGTADPVSPALPEPPRRSATRTKYATDA
jgi:DNA-binding transcriptional MerR regulator